MLDACPVTREQSSLVPTLRACEGTGILLEHSVYCPRANRVSVRGRIRGRRGSGSPCDQSSRHPGRTQGFRTSARDPLAMGQRRATSARRRAGACGADWRLVRINVCIPYYILTVKPIPDFFTSSPRGDASSAAPRPFVLTAAGAVVMIQSGLTSADISRVRAHSAEG